VVLDTDLGSDVDDALALAVLLGSPEVELIGAVTGYGPVALRARLAAGFAALAGRRLTVVAGVAEPLSGRPVWLSGQEGRHFPDLGTAPVDPRGVFCIV
jgi:purine nucleosidase